MDNQLTSRRTASLEVKPIEAPKIDNWKAVLAEFAKKPIPRGVAEMEAAMDRYAASLREKGPPRVVDHKFVRPLIDGDRNVVLWPSGLFIPQTDDPSGHWFGPPPPGMNRYVRGFFGGNSSSAHIADPATGDLLAYAAALPTDPYLRSEAGIGFFFAPTAKLATYNVQATLSFTGQDKYDVRTTLPAGGTVTEWGSVFTQAWDVSPVDESLSAVSPYGEFKVFSHMDRNQGFAPTPPGTLNGNYSTKIMLEGSHTYWITVTAVTEIDNGWTMNDGQPMQPLQSNDYDHWNVWAYLTGTVTQVWVQTEILYIP